MKKQQKQNILCKNQVERQRTVLVKVADHFFPFNKLYENKSQSESERNEDGGGGAIV